MFGASFSTNRNPKAISKAQSVVCGFLFALFGYDCSKAQIAVWGFLFHERKPENDFRGSKRCLGLIFGFKLLFERSFEPQSGVWVETRKRFPRLETLFGASFWRQIAF